MNEEKLPLVVESSGETNVSAGVLAGLCAIFRRFFSRRLLAHGALLFRGCEVKTPGDFECVVRTFAGKNLLD